ncbi:MAG: GTPase domain-containing protein [Pseudomonadota bacterium]
MAYFSPATKEITAKVVYYGPGMCGKTTNLQKVHELMQPQMKSELLSVATETDRTIYFDFLPLKLGKIAGFNFLVRVFTVPGQPYYAETRRIVLQGADGVVFVADSQRFMLDQNRDALLDLKRNLRLNGLDYDTIPLVLQFNKQDLPELTPTEDLNAALNDRGVKVFLSSAHSGVNVIETLKYATLDVFRHVRDGATKGKPKSAPAKPAASPTAAQPTPIAPAAVAAAPAATSGLKIDPFAAAMSRPVPPANPFESSGVRSLPEAGAVPPPTSAATPLEHLVGRVVEGAEAADVPMPSKQGLAQQEFANLLVLHHKLVERVATLEGDLRKVKQDYQDIKNILGRKLR